VAGVNKGGGVRADRLVGSAVEALGTPGAEPVHHFILSIPKRFLAQLINWRPLAAFLPRVQCPGRDIQSSRNALNADPLSLYVYRLHGKLRTQKKPGRRIGRAVGDFEMLTAVAVFLVQRFTIASCL
jgi:hypothetical protein